MQYYGPKTNLLQNATFRLTILMMKMKLKMELII